MMRAAPAHLVTTFVLATLGVVGAAALGVFVGPGQAATPERVWTALTGGEVPQNVENMVFELRLPRVLLGLLIGAALSVSGTIFQALLRNDLAEPYLLGIGPGALLGVTVAALVAGVTTAGTMPPAAIRSVFALAGAVGVAVLVFSFARRRSRSPTVSVLLAGIAIGAFVHAVATMILHVAIEDWQHVVRWMLGDLGLASYRDAATMAGVLAVSMFAAVRWARDLDVLTLGDESAWHAGVSVRAMLWILGGVACLLAAASVAHCGLIGFVGLVVPHIARGLIGPSHRALVVLAALLGAGLLVFADTVSRNLFAPAVVPLGVVTAALGAPVLALLIHRRA